ncbi:MAG TPA: hypothetical protein VKQ30_21675 [Ktedonobacterales bacterium]|nr:hypothetical protein [Ktedonobacterales bacterium]
MAFAMSVLHVVFVLSVMSIALALCWFGWMARRIVVQDAQDWQEAHAALVSHEMGMDGQDGASALPQIWWAAW